MEIRAFQTLPDAERQALYGWGEDIFGMSPYNLQWRTKDRHFVLYEDGVPRANASVLRHEVVLDGRPMAVGGLGGVVTVPEAQRRGLAKLVVGRATEFLRDDLKTAFGLLFCLPRRVPLYRSLGWQVVEPGVLIDQPGGKIPSPMPVMILPFENEPWPAERVDLDSLPW
jgi:GNAT superfamily N-acetyltransferase